MIYAPDAHSKSPVVNTSTPPDKRAHFVLGDPEIEQLARWALIIEDHYGKPMDIEWAKDGESGELFIVQARPETVHSQRNPYRVTAYKINKKELPWLPGRLLVAK